MKTKARKVSGKVQGMLVKGLVRGTAATLVAILSSLGNLAIAGDPFRSSDPHDIGDRTEAAFEALFVEGNYPAANDAILKAIDEEPGEPLAHALNGALAYVYGDWDRLQAAAAATEAAATALMDTDPLRGNLYAAVGHALWGGFAISEGGGGPLQGGPEAFSRLQQAQAALNRANEIDPDDPELNLLRGFLDLLVAGNLPFLNLDGAIAQLQKAQPDYLRHYGLAMANRYLDQPNLALAEIEQAIAIAPENPHLIHFRGQVLTKLGTAARDVSQLQQAEQDYVAVLEKHEQLPRPMIRHLEHNELRRLRRTIQELSGGAT
ncbi:MAG: Sll0314/Alr1548 family TPR repeat-containing protein [Cyanophyceae cyanobacterium]